MRVGKSQASIYFRLTRVLADETVPSFPSES